MYNLKKIFREKRNILIIITFSILLLSLIFLFKYIFVVEKNIEKEIYNRPINRNIIIYDNIANLKEKLTTNKDITYYYPDYQKLNLSNSEINFLNIKPYLKEDMPSLLLGRLPSEENEIILPKYTVIRKERIDLTNYYDKEINFILNDEENITFYVSGIYETDYSFDAYYNLENIKYLFEKTSSTNLTGNTRIIINEYKNLDKVLKSFNNKGNLYDPIGLDEINFYENIFKLVILAIIVDIIFTFIVIIVIFNIIFFNNKKNNFIYKVLGCNNKKLCWLSIKNIMYILGISLIVSFIIYLLSIAIFNNLFNNIILKSLFKLNGTLVTIFYILLFLIIISIILLININYLIHKNNQNC